MASGGDKTCIIVGGLLNYNEFVDACEKRHIEPAAIDVPRTVYRNGLTFKDLLKVPGGFFCPLQAEILHAVADKLRTSKARTVVCNVCPEISRYVYAMYKTAVLKEFPLKRYNDTVKEEELAFEKALKTYSKVVYVIMTSYDKDKLDRSVNEQILKGSPPMSPEMEYFYSKQYTDVLPHKLGIIHDKRVVITISNTRSLEDTFKALNI